jgi:Tfp pilus assembly protein PilV
MSILEVLLAMAIFLMSLLGLAQLLSISAELALETEFTNRAQQLCQSKMNEFVSGALPMTSQGETPFDEDNNWNWSAECQPDGTVTNLYTVTLHVKRTRSDGTMFDATFTQMIIDPTSKGAVEPPPSTTPTTPTTGGN